MPEKAAERAFAMGEGDTFPFRLARDLGMTVAELGLMPNDEYVQWCAFYTYEAAMIDFERRKHGGRGPH